MPYFLPDEETLEPDGLAALQKEKLAAMLREVFAANAFYRERLGRIAATDRGASGGDRVDALVERFADVPFTTRGALQEDQRRHPPYGTNLTYPLDRYVRLHQTSGSSSETAARGGPDALPAVPLRWLDTPESWAWFKKCWGMIYAAAGVTRRDRIFFPFSFGPFVGFWAAFEAAAELGNFCLPAGGMTTTARLRHLLDNGATVVCCTPTYALRMAEVAADSGLGLASSPVRALIVAGEPGGNIPATRKRIESAWGARVFDHTGMTEIGSCSFECTESPGGVHVIESEFIPEVVDPASGKPLAGGESGELVLTNLGRRGSPLIRYRTGDQVRMIRERCACGRWFARLEGGILGRCDDMVIIRGNNVFPSTVEGVLRSFDEIREYRVEVGRRSSMTDLRITIEPRGGSEPSRLADRVGAALRDAFHFKPAVKAVAPGSLPRFEMKARRWVVDDEEA